MDKYKLSEGVKAIIKGVTLYQLIALKDFGNVKAGDCGGYVQNENTISQSDGSWVCKNAIVYGDSCIQNSFIGSGTIVTGSTLENCEIGKDNLIVADNLCNVITGEDVVIRSCNFDNVSITCEAEFKDLHLTDALIKKRSDALVFENLYRKSIVAYIKKGDSHSLKGEAVIRIGNEVYNIADLRDNYDDYAYNLKDCDLVINSTNRFTFLKFLDFLFWKMK